MGIYSELGIVETDVSDTGEVDVQPGPVWPDFIEPFQPRYLGRLSGAHTGSAGETLGLMIVSELREYIFPLDEMTADTREITSRFAEEADPELEGIPWMSLYAGMRKIFKEAGLTLDTSATGLSVAQLAELSAADLSSEIDSILTQL